MWIKWVPKACKFLCTLSIFHRLWNKHPSLHLCPWPSPCTKFWILPSLHFVAYADTCSSLSGGPRKLPGWLLPSKIADDRVLHASSLVFLLCPVPDTFTHLYHRCCHLTLDPGIILDWNLLRGSRQFIFCLLSNDFEKTSPITLRDIFLLWIYTWMKELFQSKTQ